MIDNIDIHVFGCEEWQSCTFFERKAYEEPLDSNLYAYCQL